MSQGKVTASSLSFRSSPRVESDNKLTDLSTGTVVEIIKLQKGGKYSTGSGTRDDWNQIKHNSQVGFVAAAWIQKLSVPSPSAASVTEIRGVWLLSHFNSSVLTSAANIKSALDFLEQNGFNTLFVAVWNRGYTAFESQVMANEGFPKQDP